MSVCVDKEYDRNCTTKIISCNDSQYRCQRHYNLFNYGLCKERHLSRVPSTGRDGFCGDHRSGKTMRIVLAVGDKNKYSIELVSGPHKEKNRNTWGMKCPVCNEIFFAPTSNFSKAKTCYSCRGRYLRKSSEEITWKNLYGMVKGRNASKEKGFDLLLEDFISISTKNCHYCNSEPTRTRGHREWSAEVFSNGLDRVDSSMGYLINNIVPCCKYCNFAKLDRSEMEFLEWAKRLMDYQLTTM